ncbi:MAG: DUF3761 domain-containing protein [Deltaproteobacteria bacterium]|nr:DUF3761 domain-containing protein [Deltaproteobacteria bacterium]
MGQLLLALVISFAVCTGCVTRSEYGELEERIAELEAQVEKLQNSPERLLAQARQALESEEYARAYEFAGRLIELYPDTRGTREAEQLRQTAEGKLYAAARALPASDLEANLEAYSELARLNPSRPLYREKVEYYTGQKQTQQQAAQPATATGGRGYRNSKGDWVPSPTHAPSPPAGATARCRDGTYSFSRSRRGTCSHHGGVARWL